MDLQHQFTELLQQYQKTHPQLQAWRFDLHSIKGLEIGTKNNRLGGPYTAPSYKESISGEIYLIWKGQRFTSAKLDAPAINNFDEYMTLWENTAYHDPDGVGLYESTAIPEIPLRDELAGGIASGDFKPVFELLDSGLNQLLDRGIKKIDAKAKCFLDRRSLVNSAGVVVEYEQTPVEFYFVANNTYGESYSEKKWSTPAQSEQVIQKTAQITQLLEKETSAKISGPMRLIFPVDMFEGFLGHFLLANLSGSLVVNRQSRYSLSDFEQQRTVLRPDLTLTVNNLIPYRGFSYRCTSELVPGGTENLIASGKLISPILNYKYARKIGSRPTAVPTGGRGFFLTATTKLPSWEELISQTEQGLIVYSILGMHTQDASAGHFSLTADQCLLVEQGKIVGKTKAVINGDFLGSLQQETSQLCQVAGEDNPGYSFLANALN